MANELTSQTLKNISDILSGEAFRERYSPVSQPENNASNDRDRCAVCGCSGGNGMIKMYTVYVPCTACAPIIDQPKL